MDKVLEITSNDHIIMINKLCKRILGHPEILGRIIKGFIKESKDVSLEEIIELIKGKEDGTMKELEKKMQNENFDVEVQYCDPDDCWRL